MHTGEAIPQVGPETPMGAVIYEMSKKRLGMTTVIEAGKLAGLISDGDLRRLLEREGAQALERTAGEAMNRSPKTIAGGELAVRALGSMEEAKITSLVVVDEAGAVLGVLHLHDVLQSVGG